ncbi:MAG: chemotaxis-specific protein-glutamate methyltransferase CheB [Rhodospirillales bacterium]|nr:chemotaxis-specific protein-glutamate methyltransferase CheB [Rhodospirillales bacterium]
MSPNPPENSLNGNDPVQAPVKAMVIGAPDFIAGKISDILGKDNRIDVAARPANDKEAISQFPGSGAEVIIFDIGGAPMEALKTIKALLRIDRHAQVIMVSTLNFTNVKTGIECLDQGAAEFLQTPASYTKGSSHAVFQHNLAETAYGLGLARRKQGKPLHARVRTPAPAIKLRRESMFSPDVLVIASSTGGPNALTEVFKGLEASITVPIFIAQHMPPAFTASLAKTISTKSGRPGAEGEDGEIVQNGRFYIAPGDKHMVVEKDGDDVRIRINQDPPENYCRPSADPLFRSIAEIYGAKTLATVLTGMGNDGEKGAKLITEAGGTVIAQDEETCVVWGMPRAVAVAGLCSAVLPLGQIPGYLNKRAAKK